MQRTHATMMISEKASCHNVLLCLHQKSSQCEDRALNSTVSEMRPDKSRVWSSMEIHKTYTTHGGTNLSRAQLIRQISDVFDDDLLIFSSPGLTNIIRFRNTASKLLRLVKEEKGDKSAELVAKQTVKECKEFNGNKSIYNTRTDKNKMQQRRQALLYFPCYQVYLRNSSTHFLPC